MDLKTQNYNTGLIKSDARTVQSYIKSDECIRVSWIYISYASLSSFNQMQRDTILAEAQIADDEKFLRMTHNVLPDTYTDEELDTGFYIGRYQLDPYYEELTEAAFSLAMGETSEWVHSGDGMYIVRRLPKDTEYMESMSNLGDFTEYYLLNEFYKTVAEEKARLVTAVKYEQSLDSLTFAHVTMPE